MILDRWYQTEAEQSIFDYYAKHSGNPVIAMPTASGKSIVIAKFIRRVMLSWPGQRIIVGTHVEKLVKQNSAKLAEIWPEAMFGIYCAKITREVQGKRGVKTVECKDYIEPVIFGSIQSMVKNPSLFGHRDLFLIDEAHLVGHEDDTNYLKFINALKQINPNMKVIGFSATDWRLGRGKLSDGPVFTDVCYNLTTFEAFQKLINEGYLCTLIPKRTKTELNVSDVKITAGDYNLKDLEAAVDKDHITIAACKEMIQEGADRKSWMVFASGIKHAEHIASCLQMLGIDALPYHSKMKEETLTKIWDDFKALRLRCIVNFGKLTTGVDHPPLDLIGVLRATASSALWVQMLGRGMRPSPDTQKENCLVLDFAGNTKRLGPINDPVIPRKKGEKPGVAPVRICEECGCYNHARATHCIGCGIEFKFAPKITKQADTSELIRQEVQPVVEVYDVQRVIYHRHEKAGVPPMIRASYWCGLKMFSEYICLEHGGFAGRQAEAWWKKRFPGNSYVPTKTDEALQFLGQAKQPRQIMVHTNKKYPEITAAIF
jgi:DNA repair protein RadD